MLEDSVLTGVRTVMIKIAIAEDDLEYAAQLKQYITQFEKEYNRKLEVIFYPDGEDLVKDYANQYEVLLLDIEMPKLDGMATARQIRKVDPDVMILFITNMAQYAIHGYEVDAMDYILKPINYFSFSQRLERALGRLQKREKHHLIVPVKGGTKKIDVNQICYIESQRHNLIIHTTEESYTMIATMKEMEEKLAELHFFRCNKGYLVSLKYVEGIVDGCAVVNGEQLLISRGRKNEFLEALAEYMGEVSL